MITEEAMALKFKLSNAQQCAMEQASKKGDRFFLADLHASPWQSTNSASIKRHSGMCYVSDLVGHQPDFYHTVHVESESWVIHDAAGRDVQDKKFNISHKSNNYAHLQVGSQGSH